MGKTVKMEQNELMSGAEKGLKIDLPALKQKVDLLALAGQATNLQRVAGSGGGEWAGPCPFCGGTDRFHVQPLTADGGRWLCRHCSEGKWQDAIAYGQRLWPGLSFRQVCERLAGDGALVETRVAAERRATPAYAPPEAGWQALMRPMIERFAHSLWEPQGAAALDYLHRRGLEDETLRAWQVGYSSGVRLGRGEDALWVGRGVVLPCLALEQVWYLKISLLPGQEVRCERCRATALARQACPQCGAVNKYRGVKGNRTAAVFGADDLRGADMALFVEGEFDALLGWQELCDVIPVCTLGSAANRLDLAAWGAFLLPLRAILTSYDADASGRRGQQAWADLSEYVRFCPLPESPGAAQVKDLTDYYLAGGPLWPWLKEHLLRLDLVPKGLR